MKEPRKVQGGWRIDYRDQFGTRHRKTYALKAQAQAALDAARRAIKDGSFIAPSDVPTFADIAEQWFANKHNLRPNSVTFWRNHLDNHLLPALGKFRLNQIDVDAVERFRDELLSNPRKSVDAMTVNKVLTTAAAVFKYAQKRNKCASNPAALAERLKVSEEITDEDGDTHRVSSRAVTDDDVLTPDEIRTLLQRAGSGFAYTLLLTAAATGARHNELLALRWRDIDFEGGAVHVRRSLSWVTTEQGREPRYFPPKTKAGRRKIPAPPLLLQALRRWFLQTYFKGDGDLVFPNSDGRPRDHRAVNRRVDRLRKRAKLRRFTMHSLRHTFASSLLQGGASIAEVQKYMGHKTPAVTLNTYTHFLRTEDSGAVAAHVAQLLPYGHFLDTSAVSDASGAAEAALSA